MPIVDLAAPRLTDASGLPEKFFVTPGEQDVALGSDAPADRTLGEYTAPDGPSVLGAAFRQDNTVGAFLSAERAPNYDEPGFNPWDGIKGTKYEPLFKNFADIRNTEALNARKRQIDMELEDRRTLDAAPWYKSMPAQLTAGVVDLPTLLPGGAFVRGAKGGYSIARSAANVGVAAGVSTAAQEGVLHEIQETRSPVESIANVGASVILGGLLGAGGARLLSGAEWMDSAAALERAMAPAVAAEPIPVLSSAGAAANTATSIGDNSIAGGAASGLASATQNLNPLLRSLHSPSPVYRDIALNLFENPLYLKKNAEGIASAPAAETFMKQWNAGLADAVNATDQSFLEYRKAGGQLARTDFNDAVGKAMRRGDEDADPFVAKAAKDWRAKVFDPLKDAAIDAKLLPADVSVDTAPSYFSRMWNRQRLVAREGEFKGIVQRWVSGQWDTWERSFDAETATRVSKLQERLEPEKISSAAIEVDGKVFTGVNHGEAYENAVRGLGYDPLEAGSGAKGANIAERRKWNGFVTSTGRFVDRKEAEAIANSAKQVDQAKGGLMAHDLGKAAVIRSDVQDEIRAFLAKREAEKEQRFGYGPEQTGRDVADEVFNSLTGKTVEGPRPEQITVKARGPLAERTFNIPDHIVEDFLESDVDVIGRRYARVMGADVELARKFGSVDLKEQIVKIREDYKELRSRAETEADRLALDKREKSDLADLNAVRDMLRGMDPGSPAEGNYARIVRSVNHVNYLRSMGEVAIASLSETVRPAMVHGLMPYMKTIGQLATNLKGIKLSVAEAQKAGNVLERVLGHRLATMAEIGDPYASRGPIEALLENMTNFASKWNGIRLLTDMQKSLASVMTQDRILTGAQAYGPLKASEKRYLAYLGIDESMAGRVAKQFADHGETVEGVKVANTDQWTDDVARRTYRAAMNKDIDSIITTKGVADIPLFASTPTGKAVMQFKSFALASHQRVLLRGLQEDRKRFISGLIAMSTIGMFATWLKAQTGNRQEKLQDFAKQPGWWISEGLDRSGILAIPMEVSNILEKATGLNPIKSPLKALDDTGSISQKNQNRSLIGSIAGPSAGLVDDAATVAGVPKRLVEGQEVSKGQKNAAERLLPFNSYAGVRQILRYLVNPQD